MLPLVPPAHERIQARLWGECGGVLVDLPIHTCGGMGREAEGQTRGAEGPAGVSLEWPGKAVAGAEARGSLSALKQCCGSGSIVSVYYDIFYSIHYWYTTSVVWILLHVIWLLR